MRHAFSLVEVLCVVVFLGILAIAVFFPWSAEESALSSDEQYEAIRQVLMEYLGPEWADVKPGDLVELADGDGMIYVIQDIYSGEIRLHSGLPNVNSTWLNIVRYLPQRKPVLFKENDDDFGKAMRRFVRQAAGLPKEKEEARDRPVFPAVDN